MFEELFNIPIAYDTGINITTLRRRKHRKAKVKQKNYVKTILISNEEVLEISAEALKKVLTKIML